MGRFRCAVVALFVFGLLAACSDDPKPKIDTQAPTPSSATPTSVSPTPAPTPVTAEQAVRRFVDTWNSTLKSGDTDAVRALTIQPCPRCTDLFDQFDKIIAAGGSYHGGEWSVLRAKIISTRRRTTTVGLAFRIARGYTILKSDGKPKYFKPSNHFWRVGLTPSNGEWLIVYVEPFS